MVFGRPPFQSSKSDDKLYRCIQQNKTNGFWKYHCKNMMNGPGEVSDEFKELIVKMLYYIPSERPSIESIES